MHVYSHLHRIHMISFYDKITISSEKVCPNSQHVCIIISIWGNKDFLSRNIEAGIIPLPYSPSHHQEPRVDEKRGIWVQAKPELYPWFKHWFVRWPWECFITTVCYGGSSFKEMTCALSVSSNWYETAVCSMITISLVDTGEAHIRN